MSAIEIKKFLLKDLKYWCQENGIDSSGTKPVIVTRILNNTKMAEKCVKDLCVNEEFQLRKDDVPQNMFQQDSSVFQEANMYSDDDSKKSIEDDTACCGMKQQRKQIKEKIMEAQCKEMMKNNENTNEVEEEQRTENCENNKVKSDELSETAERQVYELETLAREIEILEKRKQLLQLKNELTEYDLTENRLKNSAVSRDVSIETLKEFLPVFDGNNNFELWFSMLQNLRNNYMITENMLRALIYNKLKGRAQEWLFTNPVYMSEDINIFLENMENMFGTKESKLNIRCRFQNRVWKKGERFDTYFNEKLILSNGLKMEEDEFIEYIIEGIPDVNLRNTAKLRCFTSKKEILQAFRNVDLTVSQEKCNQVTGMKKFGVKNEESQVAELAAKKVIKCYNCNSKGHIASECRKPKREDGTCFACAQFGHRAKECGLYKKTEVKNEENDYVSYFNVVFYTNNAKRISMYLECLIDSGSPISFIRQSNVPSSIGYFKNNTKTYIGINKSKLKIYGIIKCSIWCEKKKKHYNEISGC